MTIRGGGSSRQHGHTQSQHAQASPASSGFKVYGSLFKVDARYEFLNALGKGSYGVVCAARDRDTGQRVAIKKVCPMTKRSTDAKHTLREVLLLQLLGAHPNVISIHNLSTNLKDDELYIIMDLMDTDLHRVIQSSQALSDAHVKYFLHQLLRGVKYLHDHGVLHRDLKPGNLLLTKTCQLKIADFGLARKLPAAKVTSTTSSSSERPRSAPAAASGRHQGNHSASHTDRRAPMTEHVVTRWYRAPELMLQPDGLYDRSIDMWSVGCIFAEILGRKALFPGKNFLHQLTLIFDVLGAPPPEATARIQSTQAQRFLKSLGNKTAVPWATLFPSASPMALDLLARMLQFDPEKRISAQDALLHAYMQPIEHKYKGVDPAPVLTRGDFAFETKKLTRLDLRALIIKQVDEQRRAAANNMETTSSNTSGEKSSPVTVKPKEGPACAPAAVSTPASAVPPHSTAMRSGGASSTTTSSMSSSALVKTRDRRPASASATSTVRSSARIPGQHPQQQPQQPQQPQPQSSQSRVMCGSAGISMINSTLRQAMASAAAGRTDTTACPSLTASSTSSSSGATTAADATAVSGAAAGRSTTVSSSAGTVSPTSAHARIQHQHKPPVSKHPPAAHDDTLSVAATTTATPVSTTTAVLSSRNLFLATPATITRPTITTAATTTTTRVSQGSVASPHPSSPASAFPHSAMASLTAQENNNTPINAGSTGGTDPATAFAAFEHRSRSLCTGMAGLKNAMQSPPPVIPVAMPIPVTTTASAAGTTLATTPGTRKNSTSATITSTTTIHGGVNRPALSPTSPAVPSPAASSSSSSSSSSSPGSSRTSSSIHRDLSHRRRLPASQQSVICSSGIAPHPTRLTSELQQHKHPQSQSQQQQQQPLAQSQLYPLAKRRAASAGATRPTASHPHPQPRHQQKQPVVPSSGAHRTASNNQAFVGSTSALVRAKRAHASGSGQSLSLSQTADQVVASMATMISKQGTHEEEPPDPRDETMAESMLKTQLADASSKKPLATRRQLTVPKSPKFSVMSWQKKKEMRLARPRRLASSSSSSSSSMIAAPNAAQR